MELLRDLPEFAGTLPAASDGAWFRMDGPALVRLDETLMEVARRDLGPLADGGRVLTARANLSAAVIRVDGGAVLIGAGTGPLVPGLRAAMLLADDRVLGAVELPGERWSPGYRLVLLAPDGSELAGVEVDAEAAVAFVHPHPDGRSAAFEFPMGQDGTVLLAVRVDGDALDVSELLPGDEGVLLGFPSPDRLLVAPHPNDPETVRLLSWPEGTVVASLDAATLDLEQGFDLSGGPLGDRVLLLATEQGPVLAEADLTAARLLDATEAEMLGDEAFVEAVLPLAGGYVAALVWAARTRTTTLWRL